jgi:hypothetical protein
VIERNPQDATWRLVSPPVQALQSAVAATAEQITQLSPVDVQPAPAIQGVAMSRLRAVTNTGVSIEGELIASDNRVWLKLVARALEAGNAQQEAAALAINDRASAWAYALNDMQRDAIAPPLSTFLPSASPLGESHANP